MEDGVPSKNEVKDVPENFKTWVEDNADRIEKAEKRDALPYFLSDNKKFYTSDSELQSYVAKVERQNEKIPFDGYKGKFVTESKQSAVEKLIDLNKNADYEESYTVLANGEVYYKEHVAGDKTAIHFTDEEKKMFKKAELYHNHPFGGIEQETLSGPDIYFMLDNRLKSISSVYDNKIYTIKSTKNTLYEMNKAQFNKIYDDAYDEVLEKARARLNSKEYAAYINGKIYDDVNKGLAKKINLKYQSADL